MNEVEFHLEEGGFEVGGDMKITFLNVGIKIKYLNFGFILISYLILISLN